MASIAPSGEALWPYTVKTSTPPPHNFRELHTGAALAECLAVTRAWDEFDLLLREQPHICPAIVRWFCEPGDSEEAALSEAKKRAERVLRQVD